ncbi:MAG: GntR family transcriptional regulator [Balneolaceae bacterium]|nr:GntR family transcriptional regulator [Balneolaceae bacterium]
MLKNNRPRHEQISDWLRAKIADGAYETGDQLPSESQLSDKFEVSRVTVRHALKTLENEGVIYRRQGLGSFVDEADGEQPLVCLTDFEEDMKRAGLRAGSRVIRKEIEEADPRIATKLDLDEGTSVVRLDRVRLADGEPVAFDKTWLTMFYGQLLEEHNLETETIYAILEDEYQIPILKGQYNIKAANADAYLARHLSVEPNAALLLIDRLSISTGDKKIYYQQRYYCPDCIHYRVRLERRDEASECARDGMPLKEFAPVFSEEENNPSG